MKAQATAKPKVASKKAAPAKKTPAKQPATANEKAPNKAPAAKKTPAKKPAPARQAASPDAPKKPRVFAYPFASIYPMYVQKVEKKGRSKEELDQVLTWLTGYADKALQRAIDDKRDLEAFFAQAPQLNPNVSLIKGVVCGVRVEELTDPLMQKIRYMDKLVDELAQGKTLEKILRR